MAIRSHGLFFVSSLVCIMERLQQILEVVKIKAHKIMGNEAYDFLDALKGMMDDDSIPDEVRLEVIEGAFGVFNKKKGGNQ